MKTVLDTSLFFIEYSLSGELFTTPSVIEELVDLRSKCRYEALVARGLHVLPPTQESITRVMEAAQRTGDADRISATDRDILALALDLGATVVSDDFAVQNIAIELGVPLQSIQQRSARRRVWKFRCSGCGRIFRASGECPVCGSQIKRKLK